MPLVDRAVLLLSVCGLRGPVVGDPAPRPVCRVDAVPAHRRLRIVASGVEHPGAQSAMCS